MDPLVQAYIRAWRFIVSEQARIADNPRAFRQRKRLRELQQRIAYVLAQLDDYAKAFVAREFPKVYAAGGKQMAAAMGGRWAWTQADTEAVQILSRDLFDDLLSRTAFVREDTKAFVRRITRDRVLTGRIAGETATQTSKRIRDYLKRSGIRGVRYRNGAMVPLDAYVKMAVRTKTAVAHNSSAILAAQKFGTKFVQIFDGPQCGLSFHDDPTLADGLVVDLQTAMTYRVAHPNCRRSFGGRPDVTTKAEAAKAKAIA